MRRVRISDSLWVDAEPVSNAAYARFMNSTGPTANGVVRERFGTDPCEKRGAHRQIVRHGKDWQVVAKTEMHPVVLVSADVGDA